jgi:hypothetical protein
MPHQTNVALAGLAAPSAHIASPVEAFWSAIKPVLAKGPNEVAIVGGTVIFESLVYR